MSGAALTLERSGDAVCADTLARHGKSFALASVWLPPAERGAAAALYTWCRRADDAVDAPAGLAPAAALASVERRLDAIYAGDAQADPADAAFQRVVLEHAVPAEYPRQLLAGLAMDVAGTPYPDLASLYLYCYRVAGTVGLMMTHVLGVSDERALRHAAQLGIAMQLTNICRDVHEDWQAGRLYLPAELLSDVGLPELGSELGRPLPTSARAPLARALDVLLGEADRWYACADRGLSALPWRAALAIRTARRVYAAIGDRIRASGCDVFAGRAVVPPRHKIGLAAASAGRALLELPARTLRPHRRVAIQRIVRFPDDVLDVCSPSSPSAS